MALSSAGAAARVDKYTSIIGLGDVLDLTLSLDTNAYATGDVLAAPQELTNFFRMVGGRARIQSIVLLDEDAQAQAVDIILMNATGSLGAENAAFGPTDAVARTIIATISIVAADYISAGNSHIASGEVNVLLEAATDSSSLFVGAVVRSGAPTYTAAGIRLKFGVAWE
jgi:hypothetical protein